jgi:autoinducer 2 (AI-2) kinase
MAAGVGAGVYESIVSAVDDLVVWNKEYTPNRKNHKKYKKIQKQWEKVYANQLKLVDSGLTQSMWMAPGV